MCGRSRLLDPAGTPCVAAADGPQGEGCGHRRFGDGSYVSKPNDLEADQSLQPGNSIALCPHLPATLSAQADNVIT